MKYQLIIILMVVMCSPLFSNAQEVEKQQNEEKMLRAKRNIHLIDSARKAFNHEKQVLKKERIFNNFISGQFEQEKFYFTARSLMLRDLAEQFAAINNITVSNAYIEKIENERTKNEATRLAAAAYAKAGNLAQGIKMLETILDSFILPDGTLKSENSFNYSYALKVYLEILSEGSEAQIVRYLKPLYDFSGGYFPSDVSDRLNSPDLDPEKQLFYRYANALRAKASAGLIAGIIVKAFQIGSVPEHMQAAVQNDFAEVPGLNQYIRQLSGAGKADFDKNVSRLFAKPDMNGKIWGVESLKGKYVLIDFWGSWCLPCRFTHPHLREIYSKYKGEGFEIVGVAMEAPADLEKQKQKWKKAIAEDNIEWIQLLSNENEVAFDAVKAFGIGSFPTKILLDKNGNEITRYGGIKGEELDARLKEIFGH